MIISRAEVEAAVSAYRTTRKRRAQAAESVAHDSGDTYVSSTDAATFADLAASVIGEPMYREALVSDLRRRVAEGKYFMPAEQIVEKMLGRMMLQALPA